MTYDIRENTQFGSREIYFDGKPSEAIRAALKGLKMRWHSSKKCWYGYAKEAEIIAAILGTNTADETETTDFASVTTDGYLGGGAYYGAKSGQHLYGKDLSAAIRSDIKKAGIKGVTVSCKTSSVTVTIKTTADDIIPEDKFVLTDDMRIEMAWRTAYCRDKDGYFYNITDDEYYSSNAEKQKQIREDNRRAIWYDEAGRSCQLNQYYLDKYRAFTEEFMKKLKKINSIINAYRFDESNSMVDYFNTNFYYDIITKPTFIDEVKE